MKQITYTMREDGLMYPDLTISEKKIELGPFAMKRKNFLQQHRRSLFALLVMKGQLTEHLAEIEQRAIDMLEKLTEQMAQTMGVTEQLKAQDQMAWVQQMNSIRHSAAEIVNEQVIYS